ncbi:CehA/McbA family metallohydrolase [Paenibacillus donghaensis]|uniref:CehA/McbA family metallohydrolase n=1 Tax=Paenibacillus donghaensis TaxID=414771 RepID=UPI0018846B27|nr:CehA/McbA family metallohydrolase [Paenibacillus donghaensis]MBE9916128.1 CehA/McbA family metallohydrolase [Paenibacillus donghaensis]
MKWLPFELHTHTPHSDGTHTLLEMCRKAKELGLSGIALTDHNTTSGMADAASVTEETGIAVIPGLEWTTFYGHMLTLGVPYSEWRDLGPTDIHKGIDRVHEQGGIVGIAHPFSLGSPICTGCHWEYAVQDWNQIDYMEVWHETLPPMRNHNAPAFENWTRLLNEGYRISGTAGRDWHRTSDEDDLPAFTYLGLKHENGLPGTEDVVDAIRSGRICVSMGPLLELQITCGEDRCGLGEVIDVKSAGADASYELKVQVIPSAHPGRQTGSNEPGRIIIIETNAGEILRRPVNEGTDEIRYSFSPEGLKWMRIRLSGMLNGALTTLAFTNPIYFEGAAS